MSDTDQIIQRTDRLDDGVCIALAGDIDLSRSPQLRLELMQVIENEPDRLVVDLSGVGYMDSSGVATLVEGLQQVRKHKGRMILAGLQPKVRSIFEIARLDMVFDIAEDVEQARSK